MGSGPITFLRQTFSTFDTTGAIAPSSSFLAKAMVQSLPATADFPDDFQVLEVGCGTGAFTAAIASRMNGRGHLHVFEINPSFVAHLKERVERESVFSSMRGHMTITERNVLELDAVRRFDAIVSGLPFNNFTPDAVRCFLEHFRDLLKPGGTLTFFEYVAVRTLQMPFVSSARRRRLRGIAEVVDEFAAAGQFEEKIVLVNIPPARAALAVLIIFIAACPGTAFFYYEGWPIRPKDGWVSEANKKPRFMHPSLNRCIERALQAVRLSENV